RAAEPAPLTPACSLRVSWGPSRPESREAIEQPERGERSDRVGRHGRPPGRPGDAGPPQQRHDGEQRRDEGELSDLDTYVEREERQRDLGMREPEAGGGGGETPAVQ